MKLSDATAKQLYTLFWRHLRCYNRNMDKTYMNNRGDYLKQALMHMNSAHAYSKALQERAGSANKHVLVSSHIHNGGRTDRYNRRFWVYKRLGADRGVKMLERWDAITDGDRDRF